MNKLYIVCFKSKKKRKKKVKPFKNPKHDISLMYFHVSFMIYVIGRKSA